jgi:hypothetical protein
MASRDKTLMQNYFDSYLFNHLIKNLPVAFSNSEVDIYKIPRFSPPGDESSTAIVVPTSIIKTTWNEPLVPTENTVALFHFDEADANLTRDYSEYNNDGQAISGSWAVGKFGEGLLCDGANTYMDVGNDNSLSITDGISISVWVKLNSYWNSSGIICIKADRTSWNANNYYLRVDSDRTVSFIWGDGINYKKYTTVSNLEVEKWYHLNVEWNGIKINGIDAVTVTEGMAVSHTPSRGNLYIGGSVSNNGPVSVFNGIIDEFCIMNTLNSIDNSIIFEYYYPIEMLALSGSNYTIVSDNADLSIFSTIIIADFSNIDPSKILNQIKSGATLIILRTNDVGLFSRFFIDNSINSTFLANKIVCDDTSVVIPELSVFKIKPLDDVSASAFYMNNEGNIAPFVFRKSFGDIQAIYVDLSSYLQNIEADSTIRKQLFSKISDIFAVLKFNLPIYHDTFNRAIFPSAPVAMAKAIDFSGVINLNFEAFSLENGSFHAEKVIIGNLTQYDVYIERIKCNGLTFSTINSESGEITDGLWNNVAIKLNEAFNWTISLPSGSQVEMFTSNKELLLIGDDQETLNIINLCSIEKNSTNILLRNLSIGVEGKLHFSNFYHKFPFWINQNGVRVVPYSTGESITFEGKMQFPIYVVDPETVYIPSLMLYGSWNQPVVIAPEQNVPWGSIFLTPVLLLIIIAIVAIILYFKDRFKKNLVTSESMQSE